MVAKDFNDQMISPQPADIPQLIAISKRDLLPAGSIEAAKEDLRLIVSETLAVRRRYIGNLRLQPGTDN